MPLAAIPTCYVVGAHPACCSEVATYEYVAPTDPHRIDTSVQGIRASHTITRTASQRVPLAAIPARYSVGANPTCCSEGATHIHIAPTNDHCIHATIHTVI